jgi:hypothetical protein
MDDSFGEHMVRDTKTHYQGRQWKKVKMEAIQWDKDDAVRSTVLDMQQMQQMQPNTRTRL